MRIRLFLDGAGAISIQAASTSRMLTVLIVYNHVSPHTPTHNDIDQIQGRGQSGPAHPHVLPPMKASSSTSSTSSPRRPRKRPRGHPTAAVLLFLLLLAATPNTASAYQPADGPGQVCRVVRLDETSFALPTRAAAAGGGGGELPAVTLTDDQDLRPLFAPTAAEQLADGLTLRLDAWVPAGRVCVPDALALTAGAEAVRVALPPPASGWQAGQWSAIEAPVTQEALEGAVEGAEWEDVDQLVVSYACAGAEVEGEQEQEEEEAAIKVRLVRVCKTVPGPSLCLVSTTAEAKTDCRPCNCQACHDCACITTLLGGRCPFDECDSCPGAPVFKCCYQADCSRTCSCETCCESRPFTSCAKALTYGVKSLSPAAGSANGGAHVLVAATTEFVAAPSAMMMACRFGGGGGGGGGGDDPLVDTPIVVPATLLSPTTLACVAPPATRAGAVPVEVTLDGGAQWTTSGQTFTYCPEGDAGCLRARAACPHGWKGLDCSIECRGGAADPCGGLGFCLDDPPGACACQVGYAGEVCERADADTAVAMAATAAAAPDGDGRAGPHPHDGDSRGRLLGQGLALGLGVSALVLVAVGAAVYARRDELADRLFWSLAARRGGGGGAVELVRAADAYQTCEEDVDITVLE